MAIHTADGGDENQLQLPVISREEGMSRLYEIRNEVRDLKDGIDEAKETIKSLEKQEENLLKQMNSGNTEIVIGEQETETPNNDDHADS